MQCPFNPVCSGCTPQLLSLHLPMVPPPTLKKNLNPSSRREALGPYLPHVAWPSEHSTAPAPLCLVPHQPQVCFRPQQVVGKQFSAEEIKQPCKRCCYLVGKGRRKSKLILLFFGVFFPGSMSGRISSIYSRDWLTGKKINIFSAEWAAGLEEGPKGPDICLGGDSHPPITEAFQQTPPQLGLSLQQKLIC